MSNKNARTLGTDRNIFGQNLFENLFEKIKAYPILQFLFCEFLWFYKKEAYFNNPTKRQKFHLQQSVSDFERSKQRAQKGAENFPIN